MKPNFYVGSAASPRFPHKSFKFYSILNPEIESIQVKPVIALELSTRQKFEDLRSSTTQLKTDKPECFAIANHDPVLPGSIGSGIATPRIGRRED